MDEDKLNLIIGKNIKKYRKIYNKNNNCFLTQESLAELIGVSTSLISNLESNKIKQGISISTIYKVSIVLNVPISKLMEDRNED